MKVCVRYFDNFCRCNPLNSNRLETGVIALFPPSYAANALLPMSVTIYYTSMGQPHCHGVTTSGPRSLPVPHLTRHLHHRDRGGLRYISYGLHVPLHTQKGLPFCVLAG
jgi:hypothetical protein